MLARLAALEVPWVRVGVWQVDERVAPDGDADRNATATRRARWHPPPDAGHRRRSRRRVGTVRRGPARPLRRRAPRHGSRRPHRVVAARRPGGRARRAGGVVAAVPGPSPDDAHASGRQPAPGPASCCSTGATRPLPSATGSRAPAPCRSPAWSTPTRSSSPIAPPRHCSTRRANGEARRRLFDRLRRAVPDPCRVDAVATQRRRPARDRRAVRRRAVQRVARVHRRPRQPLPPAHDAGRTHPGGGARHRRHARRDRRRHDRPAERGRRHPRLGARVLPGQPLLPVGPAR